MGCSVNPCVCEYEKLFNEMKAYIEKSSEKSIDVDFLQKVFAQFGKQYGEYYVMLHNEHADDYISTWEFTEFIDRYYHIENSYDILLKHEDHKVEWYKNAEEVAEELGVELPDEENDGEWYDEEDQ